MLDHLGENVESAEQAAAAADTYILALKQSRERPELDCNISVKLTQLGLDAGVDVCVDNVERVLQVAAESSPATLVMFDMEAHEYVDRTLDVYLSLRGRYPALGVCLQSCLRRTYDDARRIGGPEAIVRMTKGAYLEPPDVAFQRRSDVDRSYVQVARHLLESGSVAAPRDPRRAARRRGPRVSRPNGDLAGAVRVPDAVRDPPGPPGAARRGRAAGSGVRSLRHAVVSVSHAAHGRAAGQCVVLRLERAPVAELGARRSVMTTGQRKHSEERRRSPSWVAAAWARRWPPG